MSEEKQASAKAEPTRGAADQGSPPTVASDDPAASAFEALRSEVALVRRAMAGLAAERTAIPDYSETLGNILQASMVTARRLKALTELPALRLTPEEMARQIDAAGDIAGRGAQIALTDARTALQQVTQELGSQLQSASAAKRQRIRLIITGAVGLAAGMILWAVVVGFQVRMPPASQGSPEQRAAEILGMDQRTAGEHLIQTAVPLLWQDLVLGDRIVAANRDVLSKCQRDNARAHRCTITIPKAAP
jgi:hypothetical protein